MTYSTTRGPFVDTFTIDPSYVPVFDRIAAGENHSFTTPRQAMQRAIDFVSEGARCGSWWVSCETVRK